MYMQFSSIHKSLIASIPVFLKTKLNKFIEDYFACIFSSIVCVLPIAWLIHAPLLESKFLNRNEIFSYSGICGVIAGIAFSEMFIEY